MIFNILYNPKSSQDLNMMIVEAMIYKDFDSTANSDNTFTLTEWKGTTNGVTGGTEIIIPNLAIINV